MSINDDPLINEIEAARLLQVSLASIRRWRREGRGPVFRKLNRSVRYRLVDLSDFIASARRMTTAKAA
jgi:predicted site-specific integrase-resolvase